MRGVGKNFVWGFVNGRQWQPIAYAWVGGERIGAWRTECMREWVRECAGEGVSGMSAQGRARALCPTWCSFSRRRRVGVVVGLR